MHHGVKGQKWGVRRYMNEDGTLTAAGKKRYGSAEGIQKARDKWAADKKEYDDYALSIRNRKNRSEYEEAAYKRYKQAGEDDTTAAVKAYSANASRHYDYAGIGAALATFGAIKLADAVSQKKTGHKMADSRGGKLAKVAAIWTAATLAGNAAKKKALDAGKVRIPIWENGEKGGEVYDAIVADYIDRPSYYNEPYISERKIIDKWFE